MLEKKKTVLEFSYIEFRTKLYKAILNFLFYFFVSVFPKICFLTFDLLPAIKKIYSWKLKIAL